MTEQVTFDRKEFLDFLEWVGVTGETSTTTESKEESFTLFGNMGNTFTLDVIQSERDKVLDDKLFRIGRLAYEAKLNHHDVAGYTDEIQQIIKELQQQAGKP
jgi:hypothetical protein